MNASSAHCCRRTPLDIARPHCRHDDNLPVASLFLLEKLMASDLPSSKAARRLALGFGCALALAGCSSMAIDESTFFVDPARYDLYDCRQLAEVRKGHSDRVDELKRLMAKAETGTGGSVVSELAYRPDYASAQANLKLANRAWEDNHCDSQIVSTGRRQGPSTLPSTASGGRVY